MPTLAVAPVRRRPPLPVLAAVSLAVLAAVPVFVLSTWWVLDSGTLEIFYWMGIPTVLAVFLLVGAVLLGTGRSWSAVCLPGAMLAALGGWVLTWRLTTLGQVVLSLFCAACAAAAVSSVLPAVRLWVAARRLARLTGA